MPTYKIIHKKIECNLPVKEFFKRLDQWQQENQLKLDEVPSIEGSLKGDKIEYGEKRTYSKKIHEQITHEFKLSIKINSDGKNSKITVDVDAKIDDKLGSYQGKIEEALDRNYYAKRFFMFRFIDIWLKPYDIRKVKDLDKVVDDLSKKLKA
ncbi:MAG: hypothetical protein QXS41_02985 [Candidatus Woesearchaeota archaeon]